MKPPALFGQVLTPDPIASDRLPSLAYSPPGKQPRRAYLPAEPLRSAWSCPMLRFAYLLALLALTSGSVQAQTKKGAKSADSYRRAECYRELGYTRAQARKPTKAAIEEVDQCLARRRANPAAAPQGEPED